MSGFDLLSFGGGIDGYKEDIGGYDFGIDVSGEEEALFNLDKKGLLCYIVYYCLNLRTSR